MGMCYEKMMMIGWRNAWSMKLRVQDQGEDQRGPGKRLFERTVKHVIRIKRMPGPLQMEKGDKGSTSTRMGVSGWMFLLVPAYPGVPDKRPLNGCCCCWWVFLNRYSCVAYKRLYCDYKYHLSWIVSHDGIVLQMELYDYCDKLSVNCRSYCQLSWPTTVQFITLSASTLLS